MVSNSSKKLFINLITILIIFSLDRISKFYVIFQSEKNLSNDLFQSKFLRYGVLPIVFGEFFKEKKIKGELTLIVGKNSIKTNFIN